MSWLNKDTLPFYLLLTLCTSTAFLYSLESKDAYTKHFIFGSYATALSQINEDLKTRPNDADLIEAKIICLARLGSEAELVSMLQQVPIVNVNDRLIEEVAWATIYNGFNSSSPLIRFESLLACCVSQDAKAIPGIKKCLSDPNVVVRSLAYQGARYFRDAIFHPDALAASMNDPSLQARCLAIACLGSSTDPKTEEYLRNILADSQRENEEKMAALATLDSLMGKQDEAAISFLLESPYPSQRMLGWRLARRFVTTPISKKLIEDDEVVEDVLLEKISALTRRREGNCEQLIKLLESPNFRISLAASYYLLQNGSEKERKVSLNRLEKCLVIDPNENLTMASNEALFAASLLAHTPYGIDCITRHFSSHPDPYVRMNLSLTLMKERKCTQDAAQVLKKTLTTIKEPINVDQFLGFSFITYAPAPHSPQEHNQRITADLLTRLSLFATLASCDPSSSREEFAAFLKNKTWGIILQASGILFDEWPTTAEETLLELLTHSDQEVRLQAAIILAFTHQSKEAEKVLYESYTFGQRQTKEEVLLALGAIGFKTSIPFLIDAFQEPSQQLRIRAASALLLCMNH